MRYEVDLKTGQRTELPDAPLVAQPPVDLAAMDIETLNSTLTANGSVVRALGLVMFAEINKLRVKNADPAYTMQQFLDALKAQMRS